MTDEFWTSEEDAEFTQAELDDAAAEQAAEDQFPEGWTEVDATVEPMQLGKGILLGPAKLYTQPVESPIFEAIDRASADRTPVLETTVGLGDSWVRFQKALTDAMASFAETVRDMAENAEGAVDKLAALEQVYGPLKHHRRNQVTLIGTGYRRHRAIRGRRTELGLSRAEHARRRRLYSERLRRDRRRRLAGQAPILRSSAFQTLIPHAQVNVTKAGPEYCGMEIVAHPGVPDDQVYVVDPSILDGYRFTEPKLFDQAADERRSNWRRDWMSILGLYGSPTGRTHRATNYFIQNDAVAREESGLWNGPIVIAIDETADWAPENTADIDRWLNDGGTDHG